VASAVDPAAVGGARLEQPASSADWVTPLVAAVAEVQLREVASAAAVEVAAAAALTQQQPLPSFAAAEVASAAGWEAPDERHRSWLLQVAAQSW
jgi:hypothetical protein